MKTLVQTIFLVLFVVLISACSTTQKLQDLGFTDEVIEEVKLHNLDEEIISNGVKYAQYKAITS